MIRSQQLLGILTVVFTLQAASPVAAETLKGEATYVKRNGKFYRVYKQPSFFQRHPKVKAATIGAGVGAAGGAAVGLISGKGIGRGALIGAGTGAGVGLIRSSNTLKRHPIVRDVATGSAVGLGLGLAATRGHGKGKKVAGATAIGAAAGLGAALLKKMD